MERKRITPDERRELERQAAGVRAVRQAIAVYLVAYGISQDLSWQLAMGQSTLVHAATESLDLSEEIFRSLDDARYLIAARESSPTVVGTYDPDEIPICMLEDLEQLEPFKCPSCGRAIGFRGGDESLSDHHDDCPVVSRQRGAI